MGLFGVSEPLHLEVPKSLRTLRVNPKPSSLGSLGSCVQGFGLPGLGVTVPKGPTVNDIYGTGSLLSIRGFRV